MILKPLLVFSLVAGLLAGCVSVSGPSASPGAATSTPVVTTPGPASSSPSASPTASPSATPAPTASPSPTSSPSVAPTDTAQPTSSASADPSPTSGTGFDPRDLLFEDAFDDDSSGWGVGNTPGGDIAYVDGALQFSLPANGNWIWSRRNTGEINGTVRIVGEFTLLADGGVALLCVSGDLLYGAMVSTGGGYSFVRIGADGAEILADDEAAGLDVAAGTPTRFVLECAGVATGSFRMQLWMIGTGPVGIYESDEGPENFDRVGAYVEAAGDEFVARLEQVHAFGVTGAGGQLDTAGDELLAHVPDDWQESCFQSPVPALNADFATANLVCFLGQPGSTGAEVVEYAQFDSKADMDLAYQNRVETFGTGANGPSCQDGSGEHTYTIGDEDVGRILCVEQKVGLRFDWTDDRLNILASAVDFDGSFTSTYTNWVDGGPNL